MALLINKEINFNRDLNLSQIYIRLSIEYGPSGSSIIVKSKAYSSKEAYDENKDYNLNVGADAELSFPYNRDTDGNDLLLFAHNKIMDFYINGLYREVPIIDPSSGNIVNQPVQVIPSFCLDTSIQIVDISIN